MKKILSILFAAMLVLSFSLVATTPVAANGPPVTAGLVLHLDASDPGSVTKDGSGRVSQWADLSGAANHAAQATSANQPLWVENMLAGKPVIRFDGTNDHLQTAAFGSELAQPNTIIVLWKLSGDDSSRTVIDGIASNKRNSVIKALNSPPSWNREIILHAGSPNLPGSPLAAPSDFIITGALFHGTASKLWIDGALDAQGETGTQALTGVTVGGRYDGAVNNLNGDIAEILIYDRALSDGERQGVEQYLGIKWLGWTLPPGASLCSTTATSSGTACFTVSDGVIENLTAVAPPSLPSVAFPHGMFSFRITGLSTGQTVTLTITLPTAVPVGTVWWKYRNGQWYSLPIGDDDGDNIITITLTDGVFPGDTDSIAGEITDPGGPGNPMTVGWESSPISKAIVLAPWLALLAAIMAGMSLLVLRRRRAQI